MLNPLSEGGREEGREERKERRKEGREKVGPGSADPTGQRKILI